MATRGRASHRGFGIMLGGAVLVIAFVVWLVSSDPTSQAARAGVSPATAAPPGAAELTPAIAASADQARGEVDVADLATTVPTGSDASAIAAAALTLEPPLTDGVPVRVLLGRSEQVVPFAIVTCGESLSYEQPESYGRLANGLSLEERAGELRHYQADEHGRVVLPPSEHGMRIAFAEHEGLWGWVEYSGLPQTAAVDLRVFEDHDVVVRVVDEVDGLPVAGCDVALRYMINPEDVETLDVATTGADGIARFAHVRQYTQYYWAHTETVAVALAGLFREVEQVPFDPTNLPDVIELKTKPFTALDVTVLDASGQPVQEPVLVTVAPKDRDGLPQWVESATRGGEVTVAQVEPGLELVLDAYSFYGASATEVEATSAPRAGGRAAVTLFLGDPQPTLRGRLLRADGTPMANERVRGTTGVETDSRRYGVLADTDAEGAFRIRVNGRVLRGERIVLRLELPEESPPLLAEAVFAGPLEQDVLLGDLRLGTARLLVAGRVVDDDGEPVVDAYVRVQEVLAGVPMRHISQRRSAPDGTFEVYGSTEAAQLAVSPSHRSYGSPDPELVPPGSENVQLVLPSAGRIQGSVLLDQEWFCDFVEVAARRMDSQDWTDETWTQRPGLFELASLEPGRWAVRVSFETEPYGVTVEDVEVVAGQVTRDPRLIDVDLRGKARVMAFEVVDENGAPIPEGGIAHRPPGGTRWHDASWIEDGKGHLMTSLDAVDLFVSAEGRRSELVPNARDGQRITLGPGIPVRFHWVGDPLESVGDNQVLCRLRVSAPDQPDVPMFNVDMSIDETPSSISYLPLAGQYELLWIQRTKEGKRTVHEDVVRESFPVRDRSEPQDIGVQVPDEVRTLIAGWKEAAGE